MKWLYFGVVTMLVESPSRKDYHHEFFCDLFASEAEAVGTMIGIATKKHPKGSIFSHAAFKAPAEHVLRAASLLA